MDINSLHQKFKKNSRLQEENSEKIDSKHVQIIKNSKENFKNLEWSNFRNWKDQNDMGLRYPMTYLSKVFLGIKKNKIIDIILKIPRKRLNHYFHYSSMLDDIEIIKSIGGDYLLNENPQNKTPGAIKFPLVEGYSVSSRWLRYVYILTRIIKMKLLKQDSVWLDIGSYYGGLEGLVKKYFPDIKIIMVDFNHQLSRSYIYLKKLYPEANHILPKHVTSIQNIESIPKGSIIYVEIEDFDKLNNFKINLTTNFFSLGEMKKQTFKNYIQSNVVQNSEIIYFANRYSSSPFFEKTYDDAINIFDYKINKNLIYLDVFPISQYQVTPRKILNRDYFRNISSQYFEMIWKNKN